jgi:uncharacterized protein (DUF433 family)
VCINIGGTKERCKLKRPAAKESFDLRHVTAFFAIPATTMNIYTIGEQTMSYNNRIEINPLVCSGKPVVKGTRILVNVLLNELATGVAFEELLRGYPGLTLEDIHAALEYAAAVIAHTEVEELI